MNVTNRWCGMSLGKQACDVVHQHMLVIINCQIERNSVSFGKILQDIPGMRVERGWCCWQTGDHHHICSFGNGGSRGIRKECVYPWMFACLLHELMLRNLFWTKCVCQVLRLNINSIIYNIQFQNCNSLEFPTIISFYPESWSLITKYNQISNISWCISIHLKLIRTEVNHWTKHRRTIKMPRKIQTKLKIRFSFVS